MHQQQLCNELPAGSLAQIQPARKPDPKPTDQHLLKLRLRWRKGRRFLEGNTGVDVGAVLRHAAISTLHTRQGTSSSSSSAFFSYCLI